MYIQLCIPIPIPVRFGANFLNIWKRFIFILYIYLMWVFLLYFVLLQIHTAVQQTGFVRVKRGLRPAVPAQSIPNTSGEESDNSNAPTDPYFPLQWYLRNTGQNGGKMRLDLNVQAAWDQGITGKNVTTAIMDDGKHTFNIFFMLLHRCNK